MDAIKLLKNYKKRVDSFLKEYFNRKIKQAEDNDPLTVHAVEVIADFVLAGGKRIRPALVYYGYLAAGARSSRKIVEASMGIELTHAFLLIHDDIIDRDAKRHGVATIHERYKKIGRRMAPQKNSDHFGNSMAIIVGDIASAMANEIIFNVKFSAEVIVKALDKLQDIIYVTIPGEMLDIVMENRGRTTEKEILRMFEGKTSRYTFEGPLHLGCVLAGGDQKMLQAFTKYSLPLGKAFQIQDDILGVFGNEKKLGKPVGSDIVEGKQTLLVLKALKKGNAEQRKIVQSCLGKKDLTKKELKSFREVLRQTGSLEYSQKLAAAFVNEALVALEETEIKNKEAEVFLKGIAEYIIKREV